LAAKVHFFSDIRKGDKKNSGAGPLFFCLWVYAFRRLWDYKSLLSTLTSNNKREPPIERLLYVELRGLILQGLLVGLMHFLVVTNFPFVVNYTIRLVDNICHQSLLVFLCRHIFVMLLPAKIVFFLTYARGIKKIVARGHYFLFIRLCVFTFPQENSRIDKCANGGQRRGYSIHMNT